MRSRLLVLGVGLIFVLTLDQTVRLLLPAEPAVDERPWYLHTVQYHPILGWSGYPNYVETNDGILIQTNSLGYRDREPVEEDKGQKLRVLFLGDSFTWGDEVKLEDRFTSLVEASCGSLCDRLPPIRAFNQGIIGYGTDQSFLQYLLTPNKQLLDLVILALFTGNDLSDNAALDSPSGPRPRFIRCDLEGAAELCLEGVPVPTVVDWPEHRVINPRDKVAQIFSWSGIVTLATQRVVPGFLLEKRIADRMDDLLSVLPFPLVERTPKAAIDDRIGQLEGILTAFDRTVRAEGKGFGVLVFPSARAYAGEANDELRDYREVLGVLARLDIPFVDYYEKTKDSRWEDLFFGRQGHWQPRGHQEAAELLRPLLVGLHTRHRRQQ